MKKIPLHIKIITNLKIRRLTAVEVAHLLSVTKAAVSYWCKGAEIPTIETYLNLIEVFKRTDIVEKIPSPKQYTLTLDDFIAEKIRRKQRYLENQILTLTKRKKPRKKPTKYIPTKLRKNKSKID